MSEQTVRDIVRRANDAPQLSAAVMYVETGAAADMLRKLAAACDGQGLHLARWQTGLGHYRTRVTWAILPAGVARASQFRYQEGAIGYTFLTSPYGSTVHSQAYRAYTMLLAAIS